MSISHIFPSMVACFFFLTETQIVENQRGSVGRGGGGGMTADLFPGFGVGGVIASPTGELGGSRGKSFFSS
jgi:hypothetical protein